MGLATFVKRTVASITPTATRAGGGVFVTFLPHGVGLLGIAATAVVAHTGAAYKYGAQVAVLTAKVNLTDCWVEGIVIQNTTAAAKTYMVAVTTATGVTTLTANQILAEAQVSVFVTALEGKVIPLGQRVWIPAGKNIALACGCSSAGKSCDAWVIISRQK